MKKKARRVDRRSFISLAGGAGLFGLAGCTGFPAITSVRSPNGQLRHMAVGVWNRGVDDIAQIAKHPKTEIAALCDVDADYLARQRAKYPGARCYRDWREMFEAEVDRCDTVSISTPDHHHVQIAVEAMRRGKHVYLQKPMAKTMQEAAFLRRVAAETGVVTQMGTQIMAMKCDRYTNAILSSGVLGPVRKVYLFSTRKGLSRRRREMPAPASAPKQLDWDLWLGSATYRPYAEGVYHPLLWRIWRDLGSGWVGDTGCHLIGSAWTGMKLGAAACRDVRAETLTDADARVKASVWPTAAHIVWNFDGVDASGGEPFQFEWHDGISDADARTPANFLPPPEIEALWKASPYKKRPYEGKTVRCERGWILQPHATNDVYAVLDDGTPLKLPEIGDAPTHHAEFIDSCLAGRKARTDMGWATYMRECVIAGEIAERVPGALLRWNAAERRFDDEAANAFLTRPYRRGWEVSGL